ncbi:O-antigen ligase family protein [Pedobacter paludis]|uniref:O-antigen ligase family protein n=1 Tax=Pedobacter paludis TaxID=2203212 RepID=UPI001314299C|nr:O-antigen ligase family protein [Pedobacter paludis]
MVSTIVLVFASVKKIPFQYHKIDVLVFIYLIYNIISTCFNGCYNVQYHQYDVYNYICYLWIYFVARVLIPNFLSINHAITILLAIALVICRQFITHKNILIINSGLLAGYLCALLPLSIILFKRKNYIRNFIILLGLILMLAAILMADSRTAIIALISTAFLYFGSKVKSKKRIWFAGFMLILVCGLSILLYFKRPESFNGRILIWKIAFSIPKGNNFIFGKGIGYIDRQFNRHQKNYFENSNRNLSEQQLADDTHAVFNEPLRILIEAGLIGLVILSYLLFCVYRTGLINLINDNKAQVFLKLSISSILIFGLCSYPFQSYSISSLFYILLAIFAGLDKKDSKVLPPRFGLYVLLFICSSYFLFIVSKTIYATKEWVNAKQLNWQYNEAKAWNIYNNQNNVLRYNGNFLADYGQKLNISGYHKEAEFVLSNALVQHYSVANLLNAGYNEELMLNFRKAEQFYLNASCTMPKMISPRFYLFNLYVKNGLTKKAIEQGLIILSTPIKVPSKEVDEMRNTVAKYLIDND